MTTTTGTNVPQTTAKAEQSYGEKFTNMVLREFQSISPGSELTAFQKRIALNYFAKLDQTLKAAETKRMAKSEQYRDKLAIVWQNVNLAKLALDVVSFSSVGLDPLQPNHLNLIPYKNNSTNQFDIGFIIGYRGCELKAKKYGLDMPDEVIVELVFEHDKFKQIKKDINNPVESYEFEVVDDFNRGELKGGFYYFSHSDPKKNRIRVFSKQDIEKRKPAYASAEFWGGEKDKWENGQRVGKEKVDGWYNEMAFKTIFRAAYNSITIDSNKIDDAYHAMLNADLDLKEVEVQKEILANANRTEISIDAPQVIPIQGTTIQNQAESAPTPEMNNQTGPNF